MGVPSDHQPRLHTQINILTGMGDGTDYSLQVVYCHGGRYRFFIIVLFSRLFLLFLSLSLFPPPIVSFSYRQILLEDRYGFLLFPPFHHSLHLLSLSSPAPSAMFASTIQTNTSSRKPPGNFISRSNTYKAISGSPKPTGRPANTKQPSSLHRCKLSTFGAFASTFVWRDDALIGQTFFTKNQPSSPLSRRTTISS